MKLTDMPFECLESCVQHLSATELVNVADSNKQLRQVARNAYARLIKEKVELRYIGTVSIYHWYNSGKSVIIYDVKLGLKFLRCFGDLISDMEISLSLSKMDYVAWNAVMNYLNEYCSSNLKQMKFTYLPGYRLKGLTKPFKNIESVKIVNSFSTDRKLSEIFCPEGRFKGLTKPFKNIESVKIVNSLPTDRKLSEIFPKLRELTFCYGEEMGNKLLFPNDFFANHFPLLENLSLFGVWRKHYEKMATTLVIHPQLKVLGGDIWYDFFFGKNNISSAKDHLHKFEKLFLYGVTFDRTIEDLGIIHLKNLKELKLVVDGSRDKNPWNLPFKSDKLESLEIIVNAGPKGICKNIQRLIANFPSTKKLKLVSSRANRSDISNAVPLLEEIDFSRFEVCFGDCELTNFISQYHSLKFFSFRSEIPMDKLVTILGNSWLVSLAAYDGPSDYPFSYYQIKLNDQFCC